MPGCGVHARNYDLPVAGFKSFFTEADTAAPFRNFFWLYLFPKKLFGFVQARFTSMETNFSP
jgi:hypothetical protein